ncbi:cyclin-dependent protein kinase inhibitor SMR3-like [Neltuma alba]|nr:cyclin-dependent protein kinase inhibitor SMR3-like [Prosopis alba]
MGFSLLARPTVEFHDETKWPSTSTQEDAELCGDHPEGEKERERPRNIVSAANLKLKIPPRDLQAEKDLDESNDECKTPTLSGHKIPSSLPCPPAPKKPKSIPSGKRKPCATGNFLDLSKEIESLFPAPLLLDLYGKIKKVRRGNGTPMIDE